MVILISECFVSEKPAVVKKVINPTDVPLKQIAGVLGYAGDVGEAYKASGRWVLDTLFSLC